MVKLMSEGATRTMTTRSQEEISNDIEKLLTEHFEWLRENFPGDWGEVDQVVTGVDYLVTYDVKVVSDDSSGTFSCNLAGNQTATTTLGLASRTTAWAESSILYPEDD